MTSNNPSPHSGEDTHDLIDNALTTLAQRRGLWLGDDLTAIALITSLTEQAERFLPQLVHDARVNGHTWHQIAHALGTSPDNAQLRFDPRITHRRQPLAPPTLTGNPARHAAECGHFSPTLIMRLIGKCGHNSRTSAVSSRGQNHGSDSAGPEQVGFSAGTSMVFNFHSHGTYPLSRSRSAWLSGTERATVVPLQCYGLVNRYCLNSRPLSSPLLLAVKAMTSMTSQRSPTKATSEG
jgi:hypothetical protein